MVRGIVKKDVIGVLGCVVFKTAVEYVEKCVVVESSVVYIANKLELKKVSNFEFIILFVYTYKFDIFLYTIKMVATKCLYLLNSYYIF